MDRIGLDWAGSSSVQNQLSTRAEVSNSTLIALGRQQSKRQKTANKRNAKHDNLQANAMSHGFKKKSNLSHVGRVLNSQLLRKKLETPRKNAKLMKNSGLKRVK